MPVREMPKFADCALTYSFRRDGITRSEPDLQDALKLFTPTGTWSWIDSRPLIECEALPQTELRKFGCQVGEDAPSLLASEMLADLKDRRDVLATRNARVIEQRATLEQVAARLARPEQRAQLKELEQIEDALRQRQAQSDLLALVGEMAANGTLGGYDLSAAEFRLITDRTAFESAGPGPQRMAEPGDVVLILVRGDSAPTTLHAEFGIGTVHPDSLTALGAM